MPRIGDIIEERANLVEEQRNVLDAADKDARDLTAEERQEYDRRDARVDELTEEIRRHERQRQHAEIDIRAISDEPAEPEVETRTITRDSDEYRSALDAYVAHGELTAEQRSTLNVGTDAEGGYAVPETWGSLHESLREAGTIRQLATVITTESGGAINVPYVSEDATTPSLTSEAAEISDDAEALGEKVLHAYKYARMTKTSDEFATDSLFDVAGFVGTRLGFDLGRAANAAYVSGTGSSQPEGLVAKATIGKKEIAITGPVGDDLIDLYHSVIRPYRANASWIMADSTVAVVRKLKDENGQYLWQSSLQAGDPDLILGRPVYSDPDVDAVGKEKVCVGFGDVRRAYLIRDVGGVFIRLLTERFADKGQVAWRGTLRTGGVIVDANAFKTAKCKAE